MVALVTASRDPVAASGSGRRVIVASVLLGLAFVLVTMPAVQLFRLDPIVSSDLIRCDPGPSFDRSIPQHRFLEQTCPIVENREVLASVGLLDDASRVYEPGLLVFYDLPATLLVLAAIVVAKPGRLGWRRQVLLGAGVAAVVLMLVVPQAKYADTIDTITIITD